MIIPPHLTEARSWRALPTAPSSSNPPTRSIASTRPFAPSSWSSGRCKRPPSNSVIVMTRCEPSSVASAANADRTASPLFAKPQRGRPPADSRANPRPPRKYPPRPIVVTSTSLRDDPCAAASPASSSPATVGPAPLRPTRRPSRLSRLSDGPRCHALLSLLSLKLLDKERRSHINDFNCDEGMGLFAGLNIPPEKLRDRLFLPDPADSSATASVRLGRRFVGPPVPPGPRLLRGLPPDPLPRRSDGVGHALRRDARKAGPSVLTFFAQEQESGVLCYGNANDRDDQAGEVLRFVEFWHTLAGHDPQWLYFDSKVAPKEEQKIQRSAKEKTPREIESSPAACFVGL